jgi:DNA (cytosine-5)-methyltransferase 1
VITKCSPRSRVRGVDGRTGQLMEISPGVTACMLFGSRTRTPGPANLPHLESIMWEHVFVPDSASSSQSPAFTVAGLFAGIGGLERGFHLAGARTELLCELWEPARTVLQEHFPGVPVHGDIRKLHELPAADVVAAGFPCQDLSQAGRTAGIHGQESGLVKFLFKLLRNARPRWVVIENVRNMLVLDSGNAMRYLVGELESLDYRWAYRLVDSRFTGVPQRRQRVLLVASQDEDPRTVLFADEASGPEDDWFRTDAYGFYWTEGLRGLGWAKDALPTLKGGSTLGIPSPPAVWIRERSPGNAIVTPSISDAEHLQGFPRGWTLPAAVSGRKSHRWKLVGNAVTVGVAAWLGQRLAAPASPASMMEIELSAAAKWPTAAWGTSGRRWLVPVSMWPEARQYEHLLDALDLDQLTPLSWKAVQGFRSRMEASTLRFDEAFRLAIKEHEEFMRAMPPGR